MKWNNLMIALILSIGLFFWVRNQENYFPKDDSTQENNFIYSYKIEDEIYSVLNEKCIVSSTIQYYFPKNQFDSTPVFEIENKEELNISKLGNDDDNYIVYITSKYTIDFSIYNSEQFDENFFYRTNHQILGEADVIINNFYLDSPIGKIKLNQNEINEAYNYLYGLYDIDYYSPHTKFPQYFQSDYGHVPFSGGTIKTHGCGITSFSMVTSYIFQKTITPDMLAEEYNSSNPAGAMEAAMRGYDLLPTKYYGDIVHEYMWDAIADGKPVIALMKSTSLFTDTGHFILIAGMTEDEKYIVYDPNKFNYNKSNLKEKFKTGFTKEELSLGLSGCYIFDDVPAKLIAPSLKEILENVENMLDKQNLT